MRHSCFSLLVAFVLFLSLPSAWAQEHPFQPLLDSPLSTYASASVTALWADYDGDLDLDLLVGDSFGLDKLFVNEGAGGFSLIEEDFSQFGALNNGVWADLDNDRDLDFAAGSLSPSSLFVNQGAGELAYVASALDEYDDVRDVTAVDLDNDGRLELLLSRRDAQPNVLLRNTRRRGFVLDERGDFDNTANTANATCVSDYDGDGDQDAFVVTSGEEPNELLRNDDGTLVHIDGGDTTTDLYASPSCAWADYDNDGDFDLATVSAGDASNRLFRNDGTALVEVTEIAGLGGVTDSFNLAWGDVDHDADMDLLVVGRYEAATIYLNQGDGSFVPMPFDSEYTSQVWIVAAGLGDYDDDGDLDLFVAAGNSDADEYNRLYRNTTDEQGNWLQVRLTGVRSNRDGVGARIEAYAEVDGQPLRQVRELRTHNGRHAQSGLRAHFGLGDAAALDSIVVYWPSGVRQVVEQPSINTILQVVETRQRRSASSMVTNQSVQAGLVSFAIPSVYPNPTTGAATIEVQAEEQGPVTMEIFDMRGRRVWSFMQVAEAGEVLRVTWPADSRELAAGTYTVQIRARGQLATRQLTLIR